MKKQYLSFDRVPTGSYFHVGGGWWFKALYEDTSRGERFNAFSVNPFIPLIDSTAGKLFDEATLVRLVIEELPLVEEKIIPFPMPKRART